MSTQVLLEALTRRWPVDTVSHRPGILPGLDRAPRGSDTHWTLASQPLTPHVEGYAAAAVFRRQFAGMRGAWVVNSRYAALPMVARVPYILWEATTLADEMAATSGAESRRAGLGTGVGAVLHSVLLPLNRRMERRCYERASTLVAMSEYTRARMLAEHGLAPDRVTCLPHPPTSAFLDALRQARPSVREREASPLVKLLFVGRVDDPRKNFELLREAYRVARSRGIQLSLTVIGKYTARWRARIGLDEHADAVSFRGSVGLDDLVRAYLTHDLLVLPSRQEGFGIVVAEALHAGLPVISTRCGGPEHTITSSGGGTLVDHDVEQFANAIARLSRDHARRRDMIARARAYAEHELAFDTFAQRVHTITERVLTARGA